MVSAAVPKSNEANDSLVAAVQGFARMIVNGRAAEAALRRAGIELTGAEIHLLHALFSTGQSIRLGDLADRLVLDAPTVTRRVQHLESRHLVRRQSDPADKRAQLVSLTPAGTRSLLRGVAAFQQWLEEVLVDWSKEDRDLLAKLLGQFTNDLYEAIGCNGR